MIIKNLDAYLPMPRIWLKMVISFIVKMAAGVIFYWAFHKEIAVHPSLVYFFGFLILVGIGFYWFGIVFDGRNPWSWLKEFWRRNIRGYTLACFRNDDGGVTYEILDPKDIGPVIMPVLLLKLGGWFKSRGGSCLGPWGWSARFAGLKFGKVIVHLIDGRGSSVSVTAELALNVLWNELCSAGSSNGTWQSALNSLLVEHRIYKMKVDEMWPRLEKAEEKLTMQECTIKTLEWYVDWLRKALTGVNKNRDRSKPDSQI